MKKITWKIVLVLLLVLMLSGCGGKVVVRFVVEGSVGFGSVFSGSVGFSGFVGFSVVEGCVVVVSAGFLVVVSQ